jgi:lysophospholipase L1-like esterase
MASMNTMHNRVDENNPSNAFIFIGDSLIQGLSVSSIHPVAVNFGIGHDTVNGVSKRTSNYQSLKSASSIIISVGINDLRKNSVDNVIADYKIMLQQLSRIPHIFIHEVLPIDSKVLGAELQRKSLLFNEDLFKLTKEFDNITLLEFSSKFIDLKGDLKPSLHLGDGLHLNKNGYGIWIQQLKQQLDAK